MMIFTWIQAKCTIFNLDSYNLISVRNYLKCSSSYAHLLISYNSSTIINPIPLPWFFFWLKLSIGIQPVKASSDNGATQFQTQITVDKFKIENLTWMKPQHTLSSPNPSSKHCVACTCASGINLVKLIPRISVLPN